MQLQDTNWQMRLASERIGEPSSWAPIAVRFNDSEPDDGWLYYSPDGCYFIPDEAAEDNPAGIQSLSWGPGLIVSLIQDSGEQTIIELAGSQVQIASDHGAALVRLASQGSLPQMTAPIVPMQHHPEPPIPAQPDLTQPPPPIGQQPDPAGPPPPGVHPEQRGQGVQATDGAEVAESHGGAGKRMLLYALIAVVVAGGGYFVLGRILGT
jgi:hypothetical protein